MPSVIDGKYTFNHLKVSVLNQQHFFLMVMVKQITSKINDIYYKIQAIWSHIPLSQLIPRRHIRRC